jgi:cystathionine beta-lyase/cystathionine gamma-synthase
MAFPVTAFTRSLFAWKESPLMNLDPADVALCVADDEPAGAHEPLPASPPIVRTSLFSFPTFDALLEGFADNFGTTVYTRGKNPTTQVLEKKLAALERGEACCCYASGMAAVSAVMLSQLRAGDHVLFVNQVYGPTRALASHLGRFGVTHDVVLELKRDAVAAALRPETRVVWMESPGTMLMRVLDVPAISELAREHGAISCLDNSWATPLLQKPLELGVDVVVHSATKYLGGHSDLVAGAVVSSEALIREIFHRATSLVGGILSPADAWLLLRGLRTLPVRLEKHEREALEVAHFLCSHPAVRAVHHPAFDTREELVHRQLRGYSGLLSFELHRDDVQSVTRVIDRLRRFRIGVSWGGVESVVVSHEGRVDRARLAEYGIPYGLIRLSVGLEGAALLIEDLEGALTGMA